MDPIISFDTYDTMRNMYGEYSLLTQKGERA